jgi:hypothetical protein
MSKAKPVVSRSDLLLNLASIVLAFTSASFAGYMVMYGPPQKLGDTPAASVSLELFDPSRTEPDGLDSLDPIVTGSIAKGTGGDKKINRATFEVLYPDQRVRYKLRAIVENTAFVDVSNGASTVTLPVETGAVLPGVGRVLRFEKRKGHWILVTLSTEISEQGTIKLH